MTQSLAQTKSSSKTISSVEIYFCMHYYFSKHEEKVLDLQHGEIPACESPNKVLRKIKEGLCLCDRTSADQIFAFLLTDMY